MKDNTQHRSPKQPRPFVLALMLTAALVLEPNPKVTSPAHAVPDPLVFARAFLHSTRLIMSKRLHSNSLPPDLGKAVRQDLSHKMAIPVEKLTITAASRENWLDTCLGLGKANERCSKISLEGWRIVVSEHWVYRTDTTGGVIKLENREASASYLPESFGAEVWEDASRRSLLGGDLPLQLVS